MTLFDKVHDSFVFPRRIKKLAERISELLPPGARVLDVGCGDGRVALGLSQLRPDVRVEGIDVLIRKETFIPVTKFDGERFPFHDNSFDVVLFVDVLHHTNDPRILLKEAKRVARKAVLVKDHTRNGFLAGPRLRFMDWVGNSRHGVSLPYNYWPSNRWHSVLRDLGLIEDDWSKQLQLYPWWANWIFGSSLHFLARLRHADS